MLGSPNNIGRLWGPVCTWRHALKFGLALFQLPAFALLSSAKAPFSTWWFLRGTTPSK